MTKQITAKRTYQTIPREWHSYFQEVANEVDQVIICAGVNQASAYWLKQQIYPTKPFGIKARTQPANSPAPGLILANDLSPSEHYFINYSPYGYSTGPLSATHDDILAVYGVDPRTHTTEQDNNASLSFSQDSENTYNVLSEGQPVHVLLRHGFPVCCDVDLIAILPRWHELLNMINQPIRVTSKRRSHWDIRQDSQEIEHQGNVNSLTQRTINAFRIASHAHGLPIVVHHNTAAFNPYAKEDSIPFPLTIITPQSYKPSKYPPHAPHIYAIKNKEALQHTLAQLREEFVLFINPKWPRLKRSLYAQQRNTQYLADMIQHKLRVLTHMRTKHPFGNKKKYMIRWSLLAQRLMHHNKKHTPLYTWLSSLPTHLHYWLLPIPQKFWRHRRSCAWLFMMHHEIKQLDSLLHPSPAAIPRLAINTQVSPEEKKQSDASPPDLHHNSPRRFWPHRLSPTAIRHTFWHQRTTHTPRIACDAPAP